MKNTGTAMGSPSITAITDDLSHFSLEEDEPAIPHPTLFFGEMVTIRVTRSLYRIPRMLLARSSTCLMELIPEGTEEITLGDPDVSATAFETFLSVLCSPHGTSPILDSVAAWADVLHLSTKWDISTIRDVAIATIAPLASLVDKLVFGRMYNVQSWVLDALIGMLGRKENLSLEEGRRMQLEDVMAIGVGRREAQILSPTCTPDNKRLRQLVADLYPDEFGHLTYVPSDDDNVTPSTSSAEHQLPNTRPQSISAEREVEATPSQEQIEDIVRWIRLATEPAATEHSVSRACILQYACKYPLHGPTILDQLMKKGIAQFKHSKGSNKYLTAIDQTFELVRLKCTWEEGVYYELARAAALRLLDHWDVLTGKPLTETPAAVVVAENTLPVYEITRFIRHLVDKKIVPITVFSVFWEKLRVLFERSFEKIPSQCPHVIRTVLKKTETQVLTNAACLEIDAFYQAVDQAQKRSEPKIAYALQTKIIKERKWPTDFSD